MPSIRDIVDGGSLVQNRVEYDFTLVVIWTDRDPRAIHSGGNGVAGKDTRGFTQMVLYMLSYFKGGFLDRVFMTGMRGLT